MPPVAESATVLKVVTMLWTAGYIATVLGVVAIVWELDILQNRWVFLLILVVATVGTSVSAIGVLNFLGVKIPSALLFAGDSTPLNLAAWFNVVLYSIIFIWLVHRGLGDLAARVSDAIEAAKPVRRALAAKERGDYGRAIELYDKHLSANPEDVDAIRRYAECLCALGRFTDAVAALRRVATLARGMKAMSAGVEIVYILRYRLGDKAAAGKQVELLGELYVGTPFERELDARLRALESRANV